MRDEFRLLGPVEVQAHGRPVALGPRQQRLVLAVLALEVNRLVPVDQLVDLIWPAFPPHTAVHAVQVCVSRLRGVLTGPAGATANVELVGSGSGYLLRADPMRVDAHRFRALVKQAKAAGDDAATVRLLDEALGLWTGPALTGVAQEQVRERLCRGLEEARLVAVEDLLEIKLRLGGHRELLDELSDLVAAHPLRERLVAALMLARYRGGGPAPRWSSTGRPSNASPTSWAWTPVASCAGWSWPSCAPILISTASCPISPCRPTPLSTHTLSTETLSTETLSTDVSVATDLVAVVPVRADAAVAARTDSPVPAQVPPAQPVPAQPVPAQLPAAVRGLAGRTSELAYLDDALTSTSTPTTVLITAIAGTAGVGKTALAVIWGHRVAHLFPAGQLYVNLRAFGPSGSPMAPGEAVRGFLEAPGVPPARMPVALETQVGLYRSLLAGRRVLVVLDNAATVEQVRPPLPRSPSCLVVVTSRTQLTGLVAAEGARPLTLDVLAVDEAHDLLTHRLGTARVEAEQRAVPEIITRCARLPLALAVVAVVAAHAAIQPRLALAGIADELRRAHGRLDVLAGVDPATDVRAVFSWSYRALSPAAARLFRLLGLHPGPESPRPPRPASPAYQKNSPACQENRSATAWPSWSGRTCSPSTPVGGTPATTCCGPTRPSSPTPRRPTGSGAQPWHGCSTTICTASTRPTAC